MKAQYEHVIKQVLDIVQKHRNDETLSGKPCPLDRDGKIMYCYGSKTEFEAMVADIKKELDLKIDANIGRLTLNEFIKVVEDRIAIQSFVLEVIGYRRSDITNPIRIPPVRTEEILYAYGSDEEFEQIINDIETEYDIEIEDDEIGELKVEDFITMICNKVSAQQASIS